jgi:hypothetical protein
MYYLPWWMQWAQALALIVISCLGSWIAFKQARIAAAKLNLDLYDRRFKIFDAARNLVSNAIKQSYIPKTAIIAFNLDVSDAVFLFGMDVEEYLEKLQAKAVELYHIGEKLDLMRERGQPNSEKVAEELAEQIIKFAEEYDNMVVVFKPYLKLGNI